MGGACRGWCVGRVLWLRSISCSPLDGGRTLPRWCLFLVGRVQKIGRFGFWGRVTCGNRGVGGKFAGFLYGWASEDGVWAGCVHWFGHICTFKTRPGEMGARGANLPKKLHLSCAPAHLLPQYCTLLGKTRHRHRPRTGRRLQTVSPRTLPPRRCQFAPPAHPTRYYQSTRPGVPPANPTCKPHPQNLTPQNSETPRPPNGRRGVNTQRGVSATRLTRQLRKSPRPQRRHLRCRLLARPLRERQRPQEQQR